MPVHRTTKNGKPAFQWGTHGAKYSYVSGVKQSMKNAKAKAERQGKAIRATGWRGK